MAKTMFSPDGYITNQAATHIPFGAVSSARNGCGWIAVFNVLKAVGKEQPWQTVRDEVQKGLYLGGVLGTHPAWLTLYLWQKGLRFRVTFSPKIAAVQAAKARAGIVFYRVGKGNHFAAYVTQSGKQLRFLNAVYGKNNHVQTMENFLQTYAKYGVLYFIAIF